MEFFADKKIYGQHTKTTAVEDCTFQSFRAKPVKEPTYYWAVTDGGKKLIFSRDEITGQDYGALRIENIDNTDATKWEPWWWNHRLNIETVEITGKIPLYGSIKGLFYCFDNLTTITGLEFLDISNVTQLESMFTNDFLLTEIDLKFLQTARNVKSFKDFIKGNGAPMALTTIKNFDKANFGTIEDCSCFLFNCSNLTHQLDFSPLFNHLAPNANTSSMFAQAAKGSIKFILPVTNHITNFRNTFSYFNKEENLDLRHVDLTYATDTTDMFSDSPNLRAIYVDPDKSFDLTKIVNSENMFKNCEKLPQFIPTIVDKTYAIINDGTNNGYLNEFTYYWAMTDGGKTLVFTDHPVSGVRDGILNVKDIDNTHGPYPEWYGWVSITTVDVDCEIEFSGVCRGLFKSFTNLNNIYFPERLNFTKVTDLSYIFYDCYNFQAINAILFQTAQNVTKITHAFAISNRTDAKTKRIYNFDKANWGTITDCSYMFYNQQQLQLAINFTPLFNHLTPDANKDLMFYYVGKGTIRFYDLVTVKMTKAVGLFSCCTQTQLFLDDLDLTELMDTTRMFCDSQIEEIYVHKNRSFVLSRIGTDDIMFYGCTKLYQFDPSYIRSQKAFIDDEGTKGGYLKSYNR